jgi:hypothetical protein
MNGITCEFFNKSQEWRRINVRISQFHAKLSNLRVVLISDVHKIIGKKGIRTFSFLKTWINYKVSPCLSYTIRLKTSYHNTYTQSIEQFCMTEISNLDWEYKFFKKKKKCFSADIVLCY